MNHIFVAQLLVQTALHRTEFDAATPHHCVAELSEQVSVDLHDARLDSQTLSALRQEEGLREVGRLASALRVDAHQAELVPDFFEQNVDAELHLN